ncbi:hypothetical protein HYV70_03820 [Candidatus Uhrbacteria bacterium]|nr:hypothetical protein [Candidatus Uhrbacteria bacterium]
MTKPSASLIFKITITDALREGLLFPFWWYSKGLKEIFTKLFLSAKGSVAFFGLDIWAKNLFVPMYGETSFTGRFVSFLVRFFMVIARSFAVGVWIFLLVLIGMISVVIVPLALFGFFMHLIGVLIL